MELRFNEILHAIERPKLQARASGLRSGFGWRYFDSILNPENAFADWSVDWEPHILIFKTHWIEANPTRQDDMTYRECSRTLLAATGKVLR